jgi:hypothetical protein
MLLFTIVGMSVHAIFMFKREILFDRKTFSVLLLISFLLFGLFYLIRELATPSILLKDLKCIYRGIFGQDAKDTYHSMDLKLMKDGLFNFLF